MSRPSLSSRIQPLIDKIGWQRMAAREKLMVGGLVIGVCLLLFFQLLFSPLLDSRKRLQKSLVTKQAELQQVRDLQKEFQILEHKSGDIQERIAKRAKTFTLFSHQPGSGTFVQ